MSKPKVGQRILLTHLLYEGTFSGEITEIGSNGVVRVLLDCQDKSICNVFYYDKEPREVESSFFQICYPDLNGVNQ